MKITEGPLYDLGKIVLLTGSPSGVFLATLKAIEDAQRLHLSSGEDHANDTKFVAALVGELGGSNSRYVDSEWCGIGNGTIAACDAYRLWRTEKCTYPDGRVVTHEVQYYLKFCLNKNGYVVATISVHD